MHARIVGFSFSKTKVQTTSNNRQQATRQHPRQMTTKLHRFRKRLKTFRNEGKENREPGVDGLKAETLKANTRTSNQPHVTLFVYVLAACE